MDMTDTRAADDPAETASWYAATRAAAFECRPLSGNADVDVCVVGGGIAALTLARALTRRNWSVAVLEAGRIGRTGEALGAGIVAAGFPERLDRIVERVGEATAREIWNLSAAGAARVRASIDETGMAGTELAPGCLEVADTEDEAGCRRLAELLARFNAPAELWPTAQVRAVLRSAAHHQGLYWPDAFHLHPLNYALGLAADARRAGARIHERTPALAVDPDGIRKRVHTAAGVVRARGIVLASAEAERLLPVLAGTVLRLGYRLGVTAPLGERLDRAVRFPGALVRTRDGLAHRIVGGDRLLWAEALTTSNTAPRVPRRLRGPLARLYPALRDSTVESVWSASADYAVHRMPQIGELAPGLWLAGAFGRHGIAAAAMAGDLLAGAILDNDDRWRLFQPYGLVWSGGTAGRAVAGALLRTVGLRAALREQVSRWRRLEPRPPRAPKPKRERAKPAITVAPPGPAIAFPPVPANAPPALARVERPVRARPAPRPLSPAAAAKRQRAARAAASRRPRVIAPAPLTADAGFARGRRPPKSRKKT